MASVFGDGMVLQQGMVAPIWGNAAAGENVSITFQGQTKATTANASGKWRVDLAAMAVDANATPMTITATNTIAYSGVYVGDVYVLSGQSNMAYTVSSSSDRAWALTQNDPLLRFNKASGASWQAATGGTGGPIDTFSATGYYFGKSLLTAHPNVPIGLINRSLNGTWIQTWTPKDVCMNQMAYNGSDGGINYGHIKAIQPYAIKGVVWYQGEYNDQTYNYDDWMRQMIGGWRRDWGQGDFPFMYVQLPRYGSPGATNPNDSWAMVRQCQTAALNTPNTGMAIYYDVSDGGLHPAQKKTIGDRLALLARNMVYGEGAASDFRSPVLDTVSVAGKVATFTFKYADNGLKLGSGTSITDLTLLAPDGSMKSVTGTLSGNTVIVDCSAESVMPNIYYAWKVYPQGNLFNTAGLPVSPFSLENFQPIPVAPSGLSATAASNNQINLSWKDSSNTETGFKIERATNSVFTQNLTLVTTTAANTTSYSNTGLAASTLYYYRVRATNGTGDSANSNTANATTQPAGNNTTLDNVSAGVTLTGTWTASTFSAERIGDDYLHDGDAGKGTKSVKYTPTIDVAGNYNVQIFYNGGASRAASVPVDIVYNGGSTTVTLNQQNNGGVWFSLGTYALATGIAGSVTIRTAGTTGYVIADAVRFTLAAPSAPTVLSAQINDGNAQRSMIKTITYTFSSPVALNSGAFTLTRRSDGLLVPVTTTPASDGTTFATTYILSFGGTSILGGSLADGVYDLVLHTSQVQDAFGQTIAGGDQTFSFFRLYGDYNGDGTVNTLDLLKFKAALGSSTGSAAYQWWIDADGSGSINTLDLLQFKLRLGKSLTL